MAIFVPIVAGATLFTAPYLYQKVSDASDSLRKFRKNLTSDNTGSSTVGDNNADVTETNDNRNNSLSTQELVDRDNARYGNTFPQGSFSPTEPKQSTKQKDCLLYTSPSPRDPL